MLIELVGPPGAGKTEIAKALREAGVAQPLKLGKIALLFWALVGAGMFPRAAWTGTRRAFAVTHARRYLFINSVLYPFAAHAAAEWRDVSIEHGFLQGVFAMPPQDGDVVGLICGLPKPDLTVWVDTPREERKRRLEARGWKPRAEFGEDETERIEGESAKLEIPLRKALHQHLGNRFLLVSGTEPVATSVLAIRKKIAPLWRPARIRIFAKTLEYGLWYIVRTTFLPFAREPEIAVLMYHAVDDSGWKLAIPPREFERQITYLKNHFDIVPLEKVVAHAKGIDPLRRASIALTFDDAYLDIKTTVLPIIKKHNAPITVFVPSDTSVPTNSLETKRLSWDDMRALTEEPLVTFESHTRTHPHLTRIPKEEYEREIFESKKDIERELGVTPRFFVYPFGSRSRDVERAVQEAGYEAASAITEGLVRKGDDLFTLKRVQIDRSMTPFLFRARLTRAVDINRKVTGWLRLMIH